ncbi:hypothetical protein L9F63_005164, partial [Diploptera punctata]
VRKFSREPDHIYLLFTCSGSFQLLTTCICMYVPFFLNSSFPLPFLRYVGRRNGCAARNIVMRLGRTGISQLLAYCRPASSLL